MKKRNVQAINVQALVKETLVNFKEKNHRTSLTLVFSLVVLLVLFSSIALTAVCVYFLIWIGAFRGRNIDLVTVILMMSVISLVLGWIIVIFGSKIPLKPVNNLINKMNRLAAGDFRARLDFGHTLNGFSAFTEISTSFNRMAEELENTELLRSDFINNFSHEFKTPIVSIAGFAKLLRKGNLTEQEKEQYLTSIEEESMRLSYMATNVLNLTKVENQMILTDISLYNLSEQIRSAVLLLEGKWTKKDIDLQLDFDEHMIYANEELLKQVWINLIDNAVKFVPEKGTVGIDIEEYERFLRISIRNTGSEIPADKMERIFNKFYQLDESHASEGNGIGLAVVKKIVDLHKGAVGVKSENGLTTFFVDLPKYSEEKGKKS